MAKMDATLLQLDILFVDLIERMSSTQNWWNILYIVYYVHVVHILPVYIQRG